MAAISDTVFATTDNSNGLMVMRYNRDAEDDATKMALDTVLDFNMGDFVNRMRRGSLVMQLPDAEMASCPVYVAVSVLGMISLCIMLPPHRFQQLQALQAVMQSHVKVRPAPPAGPTSGPATCIVSSECWVVQPNVVAGGVVPDHAR